MNGLCCISLLHCTIYNIILLIVTCYILVFFYNVFPTFVHIICDAACISHFLFVFHSMLLQSNLLSFYRVYKVVIQSLYYMSSRSHSVSDIVFLIVFRSLVFRTRYLFELVFWRITFDFWFWTAIADLFIFIVLYLP